MTLRELFEVINDAEYFRILSDDLYEGSKQYIISHYPDILDLKVNNMGTMIWECHSIFVISLQ